MNVSKYRCIRCGDKVLLPEPWTVTISHAVTLHEYYTCSSCATHIEAELESVTKTDLAPSSRPPTRQEAWDAYLASRREGHFITAEEMQKSEMRAEQELSKTAVDIDNVAPANYEQEQVEPEPDRKNPDFGSNSTPAFQPGKYKYNDEELGLAE